MTVNTMTTNTMLEKQSNTPHNIQSLLYGTQNTHLHWLTDNIAIHHEVSSSFLAMQDAALTDNIVLHIASGWRSFERQLHLWNNKFSGQTAIKNSQGEIIDSSILTDIEKTNAILLYSALPGASRHHWGTDIDVYAPNLLPKNQALQLEPWEYQTSGPMAALSSWLTKHSQEFGFYLPYNKFRGGIASEPWHLSYFSLASTFQQQFNITDLQRLLSVSQIQGKQAIIDNIESIYTKFIININQPI